MYGMHLNIVPMVHACEYIIIEDRYCTLNVHGLMHLPDVVRNLGPLWANSCFPFETANGDIMQLFHGSTGIEKQVHIALFVCIKFICALVT